ncbi:HAD family hydrolase [Thermohalobacter berrensis]|uniref:Haloacid dehalogenase n=1 Tax=Thermohalobacter berrensis TaxID=99594 RepID=A0A419T8V7_9FIRM|nr:HAD family hydrolase [Thermohalobacter berrensis]RKD33919.1 haloacid dehalogenase [Thermohalobacter berrensis]
MIEVDIPSFRSITIENVIFDYNGTLAVDGKLINGVKEKLKELCKKVNIYVLTADTFGTVRENLKDLDVKVKIISKENGVVDKLRFLRELGEDRTITVGNGNNDSLMIKESALGICVLEREGISTKALLNSDIVVKNIIDVFYMLLSTKRMIATLRE